MLILIKKIIRKILNLNLVIVLEYPNIKTFLQKVMLQIVFRMITKDKNTALWAYVISTLDIE